MTGLRYLQKQTNANKATKLPAYEWTLALLTPKQKTFVMSYIFSHLQITVNVSTSRLKNLSQTGVFTSNLQQGLLNKDFNAIEQVWLETALDIQSICGSVVYAGVGLNLLGGQCTQYGPHYIELKPHVLHQSGYLHLDSVIYFDEVDPYIHYRNDLITNFEEMLKAITCNVLAQALIVKFRTTYNYSIDAVYDLTRNILLHRGEITNKQLEESLLQHTILDSKTYNDIYPADGELHIFKTLTADDILSVNVSGVNNITVDNLKRQNLLVNTLSLQV